jgi:hypothetical protein
VINFEREHFNFSAVRGFVYSKTFAGLFVNSEKQENVKLKQFLRLFFELCSKPFETISRDHPAEPQLTLENFPAILDQFPIQREGKTHKRRLKLFLHLGKRLG